MGATKLIGMLLAGFVGIGGTSVGGAHLYTSETIENLIGEDALPQNDSFKDQWKKIQEKLNKSESTPKTSGLSKLKKTSETSPENGNSVRDWCVSVYRTTYKSILKPEDKALKEDAMTFCIYKIKEQIESQKLMNVEENTQDTDKDKYKENVKKLKTHNDNNDGILYGDLVVLKKQLPENEGSDENSWKSLKKWCKEIYESGYKGEGQNNWKLASRYCTKG